jgi:hypothetical protein
LNKPRATDSWTPVHPRGKVNLIGVVILAAAVYGGWWAWTYVPSRMDHLDVKEAVKSAYNQAKIQNMHEVRSTLFLKLNDKTLGWHMAEDEAGNLVRKEGLGVKDEQIIIEKNEVTGTISVSVEYDRLILLKPFDKQETKHFIATFSGPIH